MKVIRGWSSNPSRPLKDPLLESNGIFIEFRGGDFCDPIDGGQWFGPKYPKKFLRFFLAYPLIPFISWRAGNRGGYLGAKAYGADPEVYKSWMNPEDVYEGSNALCFSFRPFADLTDK